ncbi:MAG: Ca2+-dependent phosphoinositide-specific phospholipase C [Polyangiaceae bacterium]
MPNSRAWSAVVGGAFVLVFGACGKTEATPTPAVIDDAGTADTAPPMEAGPAPLYPLDATMRINAIQMKGSHNSYHVAQPDQQTQLLDYSHSPLDVQLNSQGVRALELDTHLNVDGTFDVFHIVGDDTSRCPKFKDCLKIILAFSDAHPRHHPIFIQIEPKDVPANVDGGDAVTSYATGLEAEITSVIPRARIITPDDVKGSAASLKDAVAAGGWPTLGASRGKVIFFIDNRGAFHDVYTRMGTSLDGRLMFNDAALTEPCAGIVIRNDPTVDAADIAAALAAGMIVRTRADADTVEARNNNHGPQDKALASGAQIISTDYEAKVPGIDYVVEIPEGTPSRCAPGLAPPDCTSLAVENPSALGPP